MRLVEQNEKKREDTAFGVTAVSSPIYKIKMVT